MSRGVEAVIVVSAGGTLQSAVDFNNAHPAVEMPFFNQDIFDLSNALAPGPNTPQPTPVLR